MEIKVIVGDIIKVEAEAIIVNFFEVKDKCVFIL